MHYLNSLGEEREFDIKEGYAFKQDSNSKQKAVFQRYLDIKDELGNLIQEKTTHLKGRNESHVRNVSEILEAGFSYEDILIYLDTGNMCFGGYINGGQYTIFTD